MPKINREEFLSQLESVQPGLSPTEKLEQSDCFVFSKGRVVTFNEDVACSHDCSFGGEGAIHAGPFLNMLRKLTGDSIDVEQENGCLMVASSKKERIRFKMEGEIKLPVNLIEHPGEWTELPEEFLEALSIVQECASRDESRYDLMCIHIHPKWLEAADQFQFVRYKLTTGESESVLVMKDHITHIIGLGMTEMSRTEAWIHFRNPAGVCLSCKWVPFEDYQFPSGEISEKLKVKGSPLALPKGLADAADKAGVITAENVEDDEIRVLLKKGNVRVIGLCKDVGKYQRLFSRIKYHGKPLSFTISPKLLQEIIKKHSECQVTENLLLVDGGKWAYATCLGSEG